MIWIALAALSMPLWLVVGALAVSLWSRRAVKRTPGVFPAKLRVTSGDVAGLGMSWPRRVTYARWLHDVLLVHRGLALARTTELSVASVAGPLVTTISGGITRLGPLPVVLTMSLDSGATAELAGRATHSEALVGPFATVLLSSRRGLRDSPGRG
jgi:hypothetical protein